PATGAWLAWRDLGVAAAAVPVRQHPALAAPPVDLDAVHPRTVRMAMDEARHAVATQHVAHRLVVDVHDFRRLGADHFLALLAQSPDDAAPFLQRLRQE